MRLSDNTVSRACLSLWIALIAVLAATTFFTSGHPYSSWWFICLWVLQGAVLASVIAASRMWRHLGSLILHSSLLLILLGGALTAAGGSTGNLILIPGAGPAHSWLTDNGVPQPLPVSMELDSFVISTHAGIDVPSGFSSYITLGNGGKAVISVNRPLVIGACRFYQSSYDGHGASLISVDCDPLRGREVSYAAYILLGIGFIIMMSDPRGHFRSLIRSLGVLALLFIPASISAAPLTVSPADPTEPDTAEVKYSGHIAQLYQDTDNVPHCDINNGSRLAERFYTSVPMGKVTFMATLSAALTVLLLLFIPALCPLRPAVPYIVGMLILWQTASLSLRWIISGNIPLSNGYETLSAASLMLLTASLVMTWKRLTVTGAVTLLIAGFVALVAWLATPSSAVTPVSPVLSTPWLAIHVSLIMTAYSLLCVILAMSLVSLVRPSEAIDSRMLILLYPALFLLAAGVFTGAVWAGQAWGQYWTWDPKETWALITLMVYCIPLHVNLRGRRLALFFTVAFLTVVMTYWGVNYLPSLHAYQ